MSDPRQMKLLFVSVALSLLCAALAPAQAQQIGDPIGTIAFKQDDTGSVNGFLIENLSDFLPESSPANVQFSHLTLTVGTRTVAFDTILGSPLVLTPGNAVDTTDTSFTVDNVLQYDAASTPSSATLRGHLLDSVGNSLNLALEASCSATDLALPLDPGDVNAPVTIRVISVPNAVPAPDALVILIAGHGMGLVTLRRHHRRNKEFHR